jgi:acetoin utilization protein AcuB
MIVSMWMTRNVTAIGPEATVAEAAALMARHHIRRLPIVTHHSQDLCLLGIISATDILQAFPSHVNPFAVEGPGSQPTLLTSGQIMHRQLETTTPDTPIEEAASLMRDQKIGALPVLRDGKLVGIITESDIFRAFVSLVASSDSGARITFDLSKGEDIFGFIAQAAKQHRVRVVSLISAHEGDRPVCVVRVSGDRVEKFLDDIWASGHLVLNVLRFPLIRKDRPARAPA